MSVHPTLSSYPRPHLFPLPARNLRLTIQKYPARPLKNIFSSFYNHQWKYYSIVFKKKHELIWYQTLHVMSWNIWSLTGYHVMFGTQSKVILRSLQLCITFFSKIVFVFGICNHWNTFLSNKFVSGRHKGCKISPYLDTNFTEASNVWWPNIYVWCQIRLCFLAIPLRQNSVQFAKLGNQQRISWARFRNTYFLYYILWNLPRRN